MTELTKTLREAIGAIPKGQRSAEACARAVYEVLVAAALEGQKPAIEVSIKKPGEPRHFADATCWVVVWEAGPHEWAISASMAIGDHGVLTEPYYSFDLCFYPGDCEQ